MANEVRVTVPTARVLRALLDDPSEAHYGLDVMHRAGLASGSLYPILRRLEAAGWLESSWEQVDAAEAGRPRRRYYRLTGTGVERSRYALAELSQLSAPRPKGVLRPGLAFGEIR